MRNDITMIKYVKNLSVVLFVIINFMACGETIHRDKKNISNGRVEFDFTLEPSNKNHKIYFKYNCKLKSSHYKIDFRAKLIIPNGETFEDRTKFTKKRRDAANKISFYNDSWQVFKIKPLVGGRYKLIIDIVNANFEIEEAEVQIIT